MHETVSVMIDAVQAAARHTFTRPELPHKATLPRQTHGQMSYTSIIVKYRNSRCKLLNIEISHLLPALPKKANPTTDEHGCHGFTNSKWSYFELFDPCKSVLSVLSVVRFGFLCKARPLLFLEPQLVLCAVD